MSSFFGLNDIFHKKVNELSGGQKQLVNLASVMAMAPEVIILDEPASQLDPMAARDFFQCLHRINRELGTTIIITEHRLEELWSMCSQFVLMWMREKLFMMEKWKTVFGNCMNRLHPLKFRQPAESQLVLESDGQFRYRLQREDTGLQNMTPVMNRQERKMQLDNRVKLKNRTKTENQVMPDNRAIRRKY